ncbi:MAG: hypothetical protein M1835_004477 [Candelina submexicana]|nr:MAG: hypothetical protein M1835_004477 [Candelina submexicana]
MSTLPTIEHLPNELLLLLTTHLSDLYSRKAFRLTCTRFSRFGAGLFATLNVFPLYTSLRTLAFVASHPIFPKEVETVVVWLPIFYRSLTRERRYKSWVKQQQESLMKHQGQSLKDRAQYCDKSNYSFWVRAHELLATRGPPVHYTEEQLNIGLAHYRTYYKEQQQILSTDLISALKASLPRFPRLRTFSISYLGPEFRRSPAPALENDILCVLGHTIPGEDDVIAPADFLHRILGVIAAADISLDMFTLDPAIWSSYYDSMGSELRTMEMSDDEFEIMRKVFKPLKQLMIGLEDPPVKDNEPDNWAPPLDRFARVLSLAPQLQLLLIVLSTPMVDPLWTHPHNLFADITWPNLRVFKLVECTTIPVDGFIAFLDRHRSTLLEVRVCSCQLADGAAWKPVFQFLRDRWGSDRRLSKNFWGTDARRMVELSLLRDEWGEEPFVDGADEWREVDDFVNGRREWTRELEVVYGG